MTIQRYKLHELSAMNRHEDCVYCMAGDVAALEKHLAAMEALQKFKDYVHKRLDDAGVPVDPESPHKAAGCRIGGRLDWVLRNSMRMQSDPFKVDMGGTLPQPPEVSP